MTPANHLRLLRIGLGIPATEVAAEVGVTHTSISKFERGLLRSERMHRKVVEALQAIAERKSAERRQMAAAFILMGAELVAADVEAKQLVKSAAEVLA